MIKKIKTEYANKRNTDKCEKCSMDVNTSKSRLLSCEVCKKNAMTVAFQSVMNS